MTASKRPPLPAAPVDLDVLLSALDAGTAPDDAVALATGGTIEPAAEQAAEDKPKSRRAAGDDA